MDMSLVVTDNHSTFIGQISTAIAAKVPDKQHAEQLQRFAELFFRHYPIEELSGHDIHDVIGILQSNYSVITSYKQRRVKVQVFNPDLKKDGWTSKNTIITVHYKNVPFVIDSVRMAVVDSGVVVHSIKNLVLKTERDSKGDLLSFSASEEDKGTGKDDELLMYLEVSRNHKAQHLNELAMAIRKTVTDVNLVNNHYNDIVNELHSVRDQIAYARDYHSREEIYEANQFVGWLMSNNFTFLGYAFHEFTKDEKSPNKFSKTYGLLSKTNDINDYVCIDASRTIHAKDELLKYSKSPRRSSIHRRAYPDHITVQAYDTEGHFTGVHHIVGLYTSQVYRSSVKNIPVLRKKIEGIYQSSKLVEDIYDGKVLRQVLETFPRDELFQCEQEKLQDILLSISQINERPLIKLFMRSSTDGFFVSAMAYIPRDQFSTVLRERMIDCISNDVGATSSDFYSYYSESILSRTYMIFRLDAGKEKQLSEKVLEAEIQALASSWQDHFLRSLKQHYGDEKYQHMFVQYKNAFSIAYQENFSSDDAICDIETVNELSESNPIALGFTSCPDDKDAVHFKVFNYAGALPLSDVIPVLERMNLKVIGEHPYKIRKSDACVWLHDFSLKASSGSNVEFDKRKQVFEDAFINIWNKQVENDFFNGLVLSAKMSWRDVALLRAYAAYMKQIKFPASKTAIVETLMAYPDLSRTLVVAFYQRFDPQWSPARESMLAYRQTSKQITEAFDDVSNLNHDRIIRQYLSLIDGAVITNFFQKEGEDNKSYFSFKLTPQLIPSVPHPRPEYEIFVYSPKVEGVHLRGGKVARVGLRWSDRADDFRTEVLGLVKAQNVKNAVIVPNVAKGGFVAKKATMKKGREACMEGGINCYKTFISGLLDVTDNLIKGKVIPQQNVVRRDGDDPYLFVAADKGTATFSDMANEISNEYGHWLGDAFASGGSQGYDHKCMGITAKGAWVSVQRHFKEINVNVQEEDFTVIGIGDMAGAVFGNGMLMSKHIRLTAAFNHLHIFIDPNPNAEKSFVERQRLFNMPGCSWEDYNKRLISKGGGVFSRDAKFIEISREMKDRFGIFNNRLTPNEFITALLKASVDLIWNGGIGTYVKGGNQAHADVGDKANDSIRINCSQLNCKVFGEGGNLGLSQKGRIEFAMHGGACNTDFIDNAAGVDCSDHEVNIKILLSDIMSSKGLSVVQRNRLLASMTDDVSELVLKNNYAQTQSISMSERDALSSLDEYRRLINALEGSGRLNRELEFIPSDQELVDRAADNHALTRPELAVLNCYVKVELKEALAVDDIADDPYLSTLVENIFPVQMLKKYKHNLHNHILRKEIIATQLANDMVNNMGITFCHRMMESTGESAYAVAKAYVVAKYVFQLDDFRNKVQSLDYKVPAEDQLSLLATMVRRVRRGIRWFLRNYHGRMDMQKTVDIFRVAVAEAINEAPNVLTSGEKAVWQETSEHFEKLGLDTELANTMSMPGHLFSGLGIVESALNSKQSIPAVVDMHHLLGDKLGFYWFAHAVTDVQAKDFWQSMARESFIDDIDKVLRSMTVSLLRLAGKRLQYEEALQLWMQEYPVTVTLWRDIAHDLQTSTAPDFAMFSVAMRELTELAEVCQSCNRVG